MFGKYLVARCINGRQGLQEGTGQSWAGGGLSLHPTARPLERPAEGFRAGSERGARGATASDSPSGSRTFPGHDCSLRLWSLDNKTCVQEITAHRKKHEEAIHAVACHPSKALVASAGADALAKVFV